MDFPGGPVVKNPPANAGDTGLIPGPGRFRTHQATMPRATTTEPALWNPRAQLLKPAHPTAHSPQQETPPHGKGHGPQRREQPPLAATRESLHEATKTQCSQK